MIFLVDRRLIISEYNPVHIIERMVRRVTNDRRPAPRVLTVEYVYNNIVHRINNRWDLPSLSLAALVDDTTALDPLLFADLAVVQQHIQQQQQQQQQQHH